MQVSALVGSGSAWRPSGRAVLAGVEDPQEAIWGGAVRWGTARDPQEAHAARGVRESFPQEEVPEPEARRKSRSGRWAVRAALCTRHGPVEVWGLYASATRQTGGNVPHVEDSILSTKQGCWCSRGRTWASDEVDAAGVLQSHHNPPRCMEPPHRKCTAGPPGGADPAFAPP